MIKRWTQSENRFDVLNGIDEKIRSVFFLFFLGHESRWPMSIVPTGRTIIQLRISRDTAVHSTNWWLLRELRSVLYRTCLDNVRFGVSMIMWLARSRWWKQGRNVVGESFAPTQSYIFARKQETVSSSRRRNKKAQALKFVHQDSFKWNAGHTTRLALALSGKQDGPARTAHLPYVYGKPRDAIYGTRSFDRYDQQLTGIS